MSEQKVSVAPTVGRIVHFHEEYDMPDSPPKAAIVVFVHTPEMVNVTAFNNSGTPYGILSVPFIHDLDNLPSHATRYCYWPKKV